MHVNFTGNRPQWPTPAVKPFAENTATRRWNLPTGGDVVHFGGRESDADLLARYRQDHGLDVTQVTVRALTPEAQAVADTLNSREIRQVVVKALRTYEQAAKNAALGNFSQRYFSSSIQMANGQWAVATNIEHDGDEVYCGERSAIVRVWNKVLESLSLKDLNDPANEAGVSRTIRELTAKRMVMGSSADFYALSQTGSPCSDCSDVINRGRYFSPDTQVFLLCKEPDSNTYFLSLKLMKEILPFMGRHQVSLTDQPVEKLAVDFSDRAKALLKEQGVTPEAQTAKIRELIAAAQADYLKDDPMVYLNEQRVATALRLQPGGEIQTGQRFDYTMRWNDPAEQVAAILGFNRLANEENQGEMAVDAIAYYGDAPGKIPSIKSLGRLSQFRGSKNTLITVIEDDRIKVRTILDYMPYLYISSTTRQKPKTG